MASSSGRNEFCHLADGEQFGMLRRITVRWARLVLRFHQDLSVLVGYQGAEGELTSVAGLAGQGDTTAQVE